MRYRLLGASGLRVSEVFLGAMTFGEESGPGAPLEEYRRLLDAYAEAGGNVVDTAINYRNGESESFVGELLVGRRDRFVVATKYTVSPDRTDPDASGNHRKNFMLSLETACNACVPTTSICIGSISGIVTRQSRKQCAPLMMLFAPARTSLSGFRMPPPGLSRVLTPWPSGAAGGIFCFSNSSIRL